MIEQHKSEDRDNSAIPDLLNRIDELFLGEDDDDDPMPEADLDLAYVQLLRRIGSTPAVNPPVEVTDGLEWEHFVLIAMATFESALVRDSSDETWTRRDVRLSDREIVSAIVGRPVTGKLSSPILRLERGDFGTRASLVDVPVTAAPLRLRISLGDVVIDVVVGDGEYIGTTTASVDAKIFSTAPVSVSVLRG